MSAVRFLEDVFTSSWTKVLSLDLNKRKTSLFYENSIWLFLIWDTRLLNVIAVTLDQDNRNSDHKIEMKITRVK